MVSPTATDNCSGTITGTHDASLPITAEGTTIVTWTYEDNCGNISTQTQNIVISSASIPTNLLVDGETYIEGIDTCLNAENEVVVASQSPVIINDGANVNIIAGVNIRFLPGFHAKSGSHVSANITNNGTFCIQPLPIVANENIYKIAHGSEIDNSDF